MSKTYTFPLDRKKFNSKGALYSHIETQYGYMLSDSVSPARLYFNLKYNKVHGTCVMTGKSTQWNETTERYERFADEAARQSYRDMFKKRMLAKFGKFHVLDDPEQQKKMLANRSISQKYTWNDGSTTSVNSQLEVKFLEFLESIYRFTSPSITEPPTIYYKISNDSSSFYLPDFYIPSLNLIVEIKGSNPHYQKRDEIKESLKAAATKAEGFNFIQVTDEKYIEFHRFFKDHVLEN